MSQLASMGFNYLHCLKAAINTSNTGVEEAMNWLLSHMDDPGWSVTVIILFITTSHHEIINLYLEVVTVTEETVLVYFAMQI